MIRLELRFFPDFLVRYYAKLAIAHEFTLTIKVIFLEVLLKLLRFHGLTFEWKLIIDCHKFVQGCRIVPKLWLFHVNNGRFPLWYDHFVE